MSNRPYQICNRCVMDTSARDITFDENGMCNFCSEFLEKSSQVLFMDETERSRKREICLARVKADGSGRKYDCIIGLSGGVICFSRKLAGNGSRACFRSYFPEQVLLQLNNTERG